MTDWEQLLVEVRGVPDASPSVVGGGASAESRRYTGCNGRLKRGSGVQSCTAEGHSLVAEEQPLQSLRGQASVVVDVEDVVFDVGNVNEGKKKMNHPQARVEGRSALIVATPYNYFSYF